ncbi:CopG family transcriptional regulator [Chloroflexota bacterium]
MADTEKITINLSVVDLGRIDLLAEQGFYSTRTDFIRTAVRNQLVRHEQDIQGTVTRKSIIAGVVLYGPKGLETKRQNNEMVEINVMGMLVLSDDITPELARATIASIKCFGVFKASAEIKEALKDRIDHN